MKIIQVIILLTLRQVICASFPFKIRLDSTLFGVRLVQQEQKRVLFSKSVLDAYAIAVNYFGKLLKHKYPAGSASNQGRRLFLGVDQMDEESPHCIRLALRNLQVDPDVHIVLHLLEGAPDPVQGGGYIQRTWVCQAFQNYGATHAILQVNTIFLDQESADYGGLIRKEENGQVKLEFTNGFFYDRILYPCVHELIHAFGFSYELVEAWQSNDPNTPYKMNTPFLPSFIELRASKQQIIAYPYLVTPTVAKVAKEYFSCKELGAPLQVALKCGVVKDCQSIDYNCHFDAGFLGNEIMTSEATGSFIISQITGAMLMDTGFYSEVNDDLIDKGLQFGRGRGCGFILSQKDIEQEDEICTKKDAATHRRQYNKYFNTLEECQGNQARYKLASYLGQGDSNLKNEKDYYPVPYWVIIPSKACNKDERPFQIMRGSMNAIDLNRVSRPSDIFCFIVQVFSFQNFVRFANTEKIIHFECILNAQGDYLTTVSGIPNGVVQCVEQKKLNIIIESSKQTIQHCDDYCNKSGICINGQCKQF